MAMSRPPLHQATLLSPYSITNAISRQQPMPNSLFIKPYTKSSIKTINRQHKSSSNIQIPNYIQRKSQLSPFNSNNIQSPINSKSFKLTPNKTKNMENNNKNQINDGKLINKLSAYRDKLCKKLHAYMLIYNLQSMNKCLKHDCYLSAYDKTNQKLLCAVCFTQSKLQKRQTKIVTPKKINAQILKQQKKVKKQIQPLQKSLPFIQSDLIEMKSQLHTQILTLKQIENILYQGFQQEHTQLNKSLKDIQNKFQQAISQLKNYHQSIANAIIQKYKQERIKHESVIKELTTLRLLAQDFIKQNKEQKNNTKFQTNEIYLKNQKYEQQLSPIYKINQSFFSQFSFPSHPVYEQLPSGSKIEYMSQSIFLHLVYSELCQSLKFNKSGLIWDKGKHKNYLKNLSQNLIKNIDEVIKKIKSQLIHNKYLKVKQLS